MYCQCGCENVTSILKQTDNKNGYVKGSYRRYIHGHHPTKKQTSDCKNYGFTRDKCNGRWYVVTRPGENPVLWARIVYQNSILNGNELSSGYSVHHLNGDCTDDWIGNLELKANKKHFSEHKNITVRIKKDEKELVFPSISQTAQFLGVSSNAVHHALCKKSSVVRGWIAEYFPLDINIPENSLLLFENGKESILENNQEVRNKFWSSCVKPKLRRGINLIKNEEKKSFSSVTEAAIFLGISPSAILNGIKRENKVKGWDVYYQEQ